MIDFPEIAINLKKLPNDEVAYRLQEYQNARDADSEDRQRLVENIRFSSSLPDTMYTPEEAKDLDRLGRDRQQYPLVQYFVSGATGNLIMNGVDPKYISTDEGGVDEAVAVQKLQEVYYADKAKFNYKNSSDKCVRNGCMGRGIEELVIDRTVDPRGRIRFVSLNPMSLVIDPSNTSDEVGRHAKKMWKELYLTAQQMIMYYPNMEGKIKSKIKMFQKSAETTPERNEPEPVAEFVNRPKGQKGNRWLCVEFYEIVEEEQIVVIDMMTGTTLPKTPYDVGTEEDFLAKKQWANTQGIELSVENITTWKKRVPIMYTSCFCRDLALMLEYRKDERQLDGFLPFYVWSFIMMAGKTIGIADLAKEAQKDFNAREMQKTKILTQSPLGKWYVREQMFGEQQEKNQKKFVEDFNDVSKVVFVPDDIPPGNPGFGMVQGGQVPQAIFQDESFKLNLLNLVCYLPPVLQGMSKGGDSGILFGRKVIEANVVLQMPAKNLETHENYKAKDWCKMAIQLYGGRNPDEKIANLNRKFDRPNAPSVTVNEYQGNDDNGNPIVTADLTILKDVEVLITQSKENDYMKQAKREMNVAALNAMPPTADNGSTRAVFEVGLAKSMDFPDIEERKDVEEICNTRIRIEKKKMMLMEKGIDAQLNPPQQPPMQPGAPQQMPPQGGGAPSPQGPSPAGPPAAPQTISAGNVQQVNAERFNAKPPEGAQ